MRIIAFAFAVFACLAKSAQLPSDPDPTPVPPLPGISPGNVQPAAMDLAYDRNRVHQLTMRISAAITQFFLAPTQRQEKEKPKIMMRATRWDN